MSDRTAGAVTAEERARALGVDLASLSRSSRVVRWGSFAVVFAMIALFISPLALIVIALESEGASTDLAFSEAAIGLFSAAGLALASTIIVQVGLRVAARAPQRIQQRLLSVVQSVIEVVGFFVLVAVFRDQSGVLLGLATGSAVRAIVYASAAASLEVALKRNAKKAEWMLDQHRSLPQGATALDNDPWPIVSLVAARALTSAGIVFLLWAHPPIVVSLTIVVSLIGLATNALIAHSARSGAWLLWGYAALQLVYLLIAARH